MPLKPKYCAHCGESVTTREIEGRRRVVCPSCNTIFYENPLPVAASIVCNNRREVMLVRRKNEPHAGMWCLPMGFAETGESIADAALRELREETGVEGCVRRLLDADSVYSDYYGDLLVITFEVSRTGGEPHPGDDAAAVSHFPIGAHPPLAFSANERALERFADEHMQEWEIQDSFIALQSHQDKAMLSDPLVELIQAGAETVAHQWLEDVRRNATTPSYHTLKRDPLLGAAVGVITQLGRWLRGTEAPREVAAFYRTLMRQHKAQGIELHELISSLALLKKHIWEFVRSHGSWERTIDVYRGLELNRRVALFFDKATYHASREFGRGAPR